MRTKMIQISFTARRGISGAWVVREGQLLGAVYAAYPNSPYLHMIPVETIFKDIGDFLQVSSIRVATVADVPPPVDRDLVIQRHPGVITVESGLRSGSALPTVSVGRPLAQIPPTAGTFYRAQKRLVVFCDGSWLGRQTRIVGAPRSNIRMLADMVGDIMDSGLDAKENPAMVYSIIPRQSNVVAGYQEGVGSQRNFLDFARDSTTGERLSDECVAVYRFIVEHYTDDHEVWLFGHSRGAYTARSVAGMINNCGIMRRQQHRLSSEKVDCLCYEIYRTYRSRLPNDSPSSSGMRRFRHNADQVWQVKQPIRFMGLIDCVGPLGLPRMPGAFEPTSFEFFDQHVSSTVQHVHHAVAVHERLSAMPSCLVQVPDEKFAITAVTQMWFPGTHYDLGRTTFRFVPQHPYNYMAEMLGLIPNLLSRTIWPNEVLADCVLKWLLEGMQDVDPVSATQIIPDIDDIIATLDSRMARPVPNSTGSGDVYGDLFKMKSTSRIANAVRTVPMLLTRLLSSSLGINDFYSRSLERIMQVLTSVTDRRIPSIASDTHPYQSKETEKSGVVFTIKENAMMENSNEWYRPRYPSKTFETFELWNEVFSGSSR
ncbi:hypothetical protein BU25DRAFT_129220 [Macroventuria anomochaeta]|uniref:Uncharacterized protein n=1 Tax=Macroventuria anomochaeta TaxID=301207 RepID=A0ACB6RT87_9PLEO|nr:uncharacterized protein BU25DRAFT_129220 [Macroventuria anomochaeta]KAF2624943.1 hypothetical protein BU25DRAFT_129220 [Macroventuria anomochaeta]